MKILGQTPYYNCAVHNWNNFHNRLELFFIANRIHDNQKKKEFLINSLSDYVYTTLKNACYPNEIRFMEYSQISQILAAQFSSCNELYNEKTTFQYRSEFYAVEQNEGESVMQWHQRLIEKSTYCEFKQNLEKILVDKFVSGMKPSNVLDALLKLTPSPVSMDEMLQIALKAELHETFNFIPIK